jgi:crotonobetainyl-CoA:carnitine CoA-transferase CaiB-like acyl-CoA transferase
MIEVALNVAAELTIEHSAFGASLHRDGNRGPFAAPQGVYACRGEEQWVAVAVADDDQWVGLRKALGEPEWVCAAELETAGGRRRAHDEIDAHLRAWASGVELERAVAMLLEHGVPAAPVVDGLNLLDNEQLRHRGYYEPIDSALLGRHLVRSLPFRFSSHDEPWIRMPAPTLGEHNRAVLSELLGFDADALDRLEELGITGTQPMGLSA